MSSAMTADQKLVKQSWQKAYKEALDADIWGQADDAHDNYQKLSENIEELTPHIGLSSEEKAHLHKFRQCLALRSDALQANTGAILANINSASPHTAAPASPKPTSGKAAPAVSLEQMKRLTRVLDELFTPAAASGGGGEFPIVVPALVSMGKSNRTGGEKIIISPTEEKTQESDEGGSLLPPPSLPAGSHAVSLHISSISLKDAPGYVNPHLRILLASPSTASAPTSVQDTPHLRPSPHSPLQLLVDRTVHLPLSLEAMREAGLSCYVEMRHWKADKKKVSVRCWALLEADEMERAAKGGEGDEVCLELYQKPVDFKKKRLNLFSVKKLYLTLSCQIKQQ